MKRIVQLIYFIFIISLVCGNPTAVKAASLRQNLSTMNTETNSPNDEPYEGAPLCLPGVYLQQNPDCLVLGPSESLTEYAKLGITIPPKPLPAKPTPFELATIPYQYIRVTYRGSFPVYNSVADAAAKNIFRTIGMGFIYFSYTVRDESDIGIYYKAKSGEWVGGEYVSRVSPPYFSGFIFQKTPEISFGWVLDPFESQYEPGLGGGSTGNTYNRFDIIYIYDTKHINDEDWFLVGMDEWIPDRYIALVNPNPLPPEGVDNGRWIELDLFQQVLMVFDDYQLVFATLVSSGSEPFYTKPGLFQIYEKLETETMSTGDKTDYYYLEDVPWTMYFDEARALHGAYWHSRFGYERSHGCVNLSLADAHWLYDWADVGDYVYVWDPSGKTPTDPSYYNGGGP